MRQTVYGPDSEFFPDSAEERLSINVDDCNAPNYSAIGNATNLDRFARDSKNCRKSLITVSLIWPVFQMAQPTTTVCVTTLFIASSSNSVSIRSGKHIQLVVSLGLK